MARYRLPRPIQRGGFSKAFTPASSNFVIHPGIAYHSRAGNNGLKLEWRGLKLCGDAGLGRDHPVDNAPVVRSTLGKLALAEGSFLLTGRRSPCLENPASWMTVTQFPEEPFFKTVQPRVFAAGLIDGGLRERYPLESYWTRNPVLLDLRLDPIDLKRTRFTTGLS